MESKRIEIYVWWTCNQKCTYCMEYPNMERQWNKKVTISEILKYLVKYKQKGFNHVTYLWWEPFIQPVFLDALKIWKKMWFKTLVTTNATTLHFEKEAKKYLPYIDELILSVEAINKELQQKISRTNVYVNWEKVFENISKYWEGTYLKVNIVITKDNLLELLNLVKFVVWKWIKNIAITYPDLDLEYYGKDHLINFVSPSYKEAIKEVEKIENYCDKLNINLKIVDFPFCVFPKNKLNYYINKTDEIDYWNRLKVWTSLLEKYLPEQYEINRNDIWPRERELVEKCVKCKYNTLCWWPAIYYKQLFWLDEINPIENEL